MLEERYITRRSQGKLSSIWGRGTAENGDRPFDRERGPCHITVPCNYD